MLKRFWKHIFLDIPIRAKMCYIFLVLLIVPMLGFSVYVTNRIQRTMREQTFVAAEKTFEETLLSLSAHTKRMYDVADILVNDPLLHNISNPDYPTSVPDYYTMSNTFKQLQTLGGVTNIMLYSKCPYFSYHIDQIKDTLWYQTVSQRNGKHWFAPVELTGMPEDGGNHFIYLRPVYSIGNYTEPNAILRIDMDREVFAQTLRQTAVTPNSQMLLLLPEQVILSSGGDTQLLNPEQIAHLPADTGSTWQRMTLGSFDYYIWSTVVQPGGWTLATLIPVSDISIPRNQMILEMLCITILLVVAAYWLALYLAGSVLKRINQLTTAMKMLQTGDAAIQVENAEEDEVGQLVQCFNLMASQIDTLMDEKVQYGQDIKNLELQALQAQINPHFLYNTLDTINCIAIQKGASEITNIVSALASFYRVSLSKGKEHICIREEISHAQMYMKILDSRFPGKIKTIWEISPEIEDLQTIKIILQPILENAAIHGIYEKDSGAGNIMVKAWLEGDDVYLTVEDDGIGMDQSVIDANFHHPTQKLNHMDGGYGIRNIVARIRIAYGPEYGLSCISNAGQGTKVTIHIPKCN